jgi:shikimate kinase
MKKHIFLIGPGSVGKTTLTKMLDKKLDILDVHIDEEFIKRIGHIRRYIKKYGYGKYYESNTKLFYELLAENKKKRCIVAVTPGLLIRGPDKIRNKNIKKVNNGLSILLVPFRGIKKSAELLLERE